MLKTNISVLYIAQAILTGKKLLEAMQCSGMQVDVQISNESNSIHVKDKNYDIIVLAEDIINDTLEKHSDFLQKSSLAILVTALKNNTTKNRMSALKVGVELIFSDDDNINETLLILLNKIRRNKLSKTQVIDVNLSMLENEKCTSPHLNIQEVQSKLDLVGDDWLYHKKNNFITHYEKPEEVYLTKREGMLLQSLIEHQGECVDKELLFKSIGNRQWNYNDRTIDVLIFKLRKKISGVSESENSLQSCYGRGYRLRCANQVMLTLHDY